MAKEIESMKTANFIPKHGGNITPRKWTSLANVTQMRSTKKTNWLQLVTALIAVPFTINLAHAALSAMTAQTIKGSAPYFVLNGTPLTNTNELVGFTYGTILVDASQSTQVTAGNIITLPVGTTEGDINAAVTFNQSTATPLQTLVQTASHPLKVADSDGDANNTLFMDATGTIQATFTKDGVPVAAGSTAQLDPCADYEINITVVGTGTPPDVSAKTTYGDPDSSPAGTYSGSTATYKLLSANKRICYLRPLDMTVNTSLTATQQYHNTTGYDPAQWVANQGFKPSAGFPTTGFKGAVFSVIGSGADQSHYKCTVTGGGNLIASTAVATTALGEGCQLTMTSTSRPSASDTITLIDTIGSSTTIDTYTINYSSATWAIAMVGDIRYNTNENGNGNWLAANLCPGPTVSAGASNRSLAAQKFFYLYEWVKTPQTDLLGTTTLQTNFYTIPHRASGGGIINEWGGLAKYTGSDMPTGFLYAWSANDSIQRTSVSGINHPQVVLSNWTGLRVNVEWDWMINSRRVICRG